MSQARNPADNCFSPAAAGNQSLYRFTIADQEFLITSSRPQQGALAEEICDFVVGDDQFYLLKVVPKKGVGESGDSALPPVDGAPAKPSILPRETGSGRPGVEVASLLTARELQIAALVASGDSNKQISRQLNISEWTVCSHLRRIFIKLGVDSRAAMVFRCANLWISASSVDAVG
jgi:DNA-binding CsgD family transcriptional regulator